MTLWQEFTGTLKNPVLAITTVLSATAPSLAGMTAAPSVALVEEVKGKVTGVESMEYVRPGTVIKLGPKDSIVLTYLKSCWRETITGGTVVIGVEQSLFHLSKVEGVKVDCDRSGQPVTDPQRDVAGTVFRRLSTASPPEKEWLGRPRSLFESQDVIGTSGPVLNAKADGSDTITSASRSTATRRAQCSLKSKRRAASKRPIVVILPHLLRKRAILGL